MRKYNEGKIYVTEFNNITELVHFIETKEVYPNFKNKVGGPDIPGGAGSAGLATAPVELDAQALLRLSEMLS